MHPINSCVEHSNRQSTIDADYAHEDILDQLRAEKRGQLESPPEQELRRRTIVGD